MSPRLLGTVLRENARRQPRIEPMSGEQASRAAVHSGFPDRHPGGAFFAIRSEKGRALPRRDDRSNSIGWIRGVFARFRATIVDTRLQECHATAPRDQNVSRRYA